MVYVSGTCRRHRTPARPWALARFIRPTPCNMPGLRSAKAWLGGATGEQPRVRVVREHRIVVQPQRLPTTTPAARGNSARPAAGDGQPPGPAESNSFPRPLPASSSFQGREDESFDGVAAGQEPASHACGDHRSRGTAGEPCGCRGRSRCDDPGSGPRRGRRHPAGRRGQDAVPIGGVSAGLRPARPPAGDHRAARPAPRHPPGTPH